MKKKLFFDDHNLASFAEAEVDGVKGVMWKDTTIFSERNNRNKIFFDINDLVLDNDEAKALFANENHDDKAMLATTGMLNIRIEGKKGSREVKADVWSTNPDVIANPDQYNNISIEGEATDGVFYRQDKARYMKDFDFQGFALLKGKRQGSGLARLGNKVYFAEAFEDEEDQDDDQAKAKFFYPSISDLVKVKSENKLGYVSAMNQTATGTTVTVQTFDGQTYTQDQASTSINDADSNFVYASTGEAVKMLFAEMMKLKAQIATASFSQQGQEGDGTNDDENKDGKDGEDTDTNTKPATQPDPTEEQVNAAFAHTAKMKQAAKVEKVGDDSAKPTAAKPAQSVNFLDEISTL